MEENSTNFVNPNLIVLNAEAATAEDCIRISSKLFIENGYVKKGYEQMVIDREKEYPTGLPGKEINIAIPHTNNTLVNNPAIGVVIPKEPVVFTMMGSNDTLLECSVILPLCITDPGTQITNLNKIIKLIQDTKLLKSIMESESAEGVADLLNNFFSQEEKGGS